METKAAGIQLENRLRDKRQALALSQKQLAEMAGITRQAVSALEANQYSPATSVALQLARSLRCRVEDLFSIKQGGDIVEGELLGFLPQSSAAVRAQVSEVRHRLLVGCRRVRARRAVGGRPRRAVPAAPHRAAVD